MQFLDLAGVKKFKQYVDENITTVTTQIGEKIDTVKVGTTNYTPTNGIVSLPAYPTTLPASDVSAWAKASTKPTYTATEVGAISGVTFNGNNATVTNEIAAITATIPELYVNITYNDLVTNRNQNKLIPGSYYRITDYVTTTTDTESRSMGHQFDIVVLAINESTLSEEAFAEHHEGDTYFTNSNLAAWKIWYALDNDTSRFAWADSTNGKGVIYRMIDEHRNDVPYDFKNIQFKRYAVNIAEDFSDTISYLSGLCVAPSTLPNTYVKPLTLNTATYKWYYTFSQLGSTWDVEAEDSTIAIGVKQTNDVFIANKSYRAPYALNNIVIALGSCMSGSIMNASQYSDLPAGQNCSFLEGCADLTLMGDVCNLNALTQFRRNIILGADFRHCHIATDVQDNAIFSLAGVSFNEFGDRFISNYIAVTTAFSGNIFADNCYSNKIISARIKDNSFQSLTYSEFNLAGQNLQRNKFSAPANGVKFTGGPVQYNEFGALTQICNVVGGIGYSRFFAGVHYVDITCPNGYGFISIDSVNPLIGTSTEHIKINNTNFAVQVHGSSLGTIKTPKIEVISDGSMIASWRDSNGKLVVMRSTDKGTTWESVTDYIDYDTYNEDQETIAGALTSLNDRIKTIEDADYDSQLQNASKVNSVTLNNIPATLNNKVAKLTLTTEPAGAGNVVTDIAINGTIVTVTKGNVDLSSKEDSVNKVTSISASSTDTQYPSAKCMWDVIGDVEAVLDEIITPTPQISVADTLNIESGYNSSTQLSNSTTFRVVGDYLTANVTMTKSGTDAAMFTLSPTSVNKNDALAGKDVTITYKPTSVGTHTMTITFASTGATSKTMTVTGTATESDV